VNYYQILGISPTSDLDEIRRRYRFLAKAYHPDRFTDPQRKLEAEKEMQRINEAYSVLSNPKKRVDYDRQFSLKENGHLDDEDNKWNEETRKSVTDYLVNLISKWEAITKKIDSKETDELMKQIIEMVALITENKYLTNPKARQEITFAVTFMIVSNLSLGIEMEAGNNPLPYSLGELQVFTVVPLYQQLSEFIKVGNIGSSISPEIYERLWITFFERSLALSTLCNDIGKRNVPKPSIWKESAYSKKHTPAVGSSTANSYCGVCGCAAKTENLTFRQNVAGVFKRYTRTISGNMCAVCTEYIFWEFTGKTLLLGWWGLISFFVTPVVIVLNISSYFQARDIRSSSPEVKNISLGWKATVLSVSAIFGVVLVAKLIETFGSRVDYSSPPALTQNSGYSMAQKTSTQIMRTTDQTKAVNLLATVAPTEASIVTFVETVITAHSPVCISWNEITAGERGKNLCVYGFIENAYWGDNIFYLTFSKDPYAFRFIVVNGYFNVYKGQCVQAQGTIETYNDMPYIELGDLYSCPDYP
jgi:hypothetical protein